MFSDRLNYPFVLNELSLILNSKDKNKILNLIESNPTKTKLIHSKELLKEFLKEENLYYDPSPKGLENTRQSIKEYYNGKVDIESIFVASGTSELYSYILKLLCNPHDNILVPKPGYPLFDYIASLELVDLKNYHLEYLHGYGWKIDFDSLQKNIDERTKAIVLINPNNPTGSYISKAEREMLVKIANEFNLALISDEVFFDFTLEECKRFSFAYENKALTFTLSGISKILALPQMKLAWLTVNGKEDLKNEAIERLEVISDTFLSASTPVQNALPCFLEKGKIITEKIKKRIRKNYKLLKNYLEGSPIRILTAKGGWNAILEMPSIFSEEKWVKKLLIEKDVLVYPGYFFDFEKEAYLIISLIVKENFLSEGIKKILDLFKENC